jgi:Fe-S-cluster-containing hydrogenase component 2
MFYVNDSVGDDTKICVDTCPAGYMFMELFSSLPSERYKCLLDCATKQYTLVDGQKYCSVCEVYYVADGTYKVCMDVCDDGQVLHDT